MNIFDKITSIPGIRFKEIKLLEGKAIKSATPVSKKAKCPVCGKLSKSVHSSYRRKIVDLPVSGYSLLIILEVHKFFCNNSHCQRKIFSEQPSPEIQKYSRMTSRSKNRITCILKETSAKKGSLISKAILTPVSPSTALRYVHSLPLPENDHNITNIGVDDWALKKGMIYGTILVNMDNGKVIDILP